MTLSVTALIDTYNHGSYLKQAIESVLDQDIEPSNLELLVVDDGSTDDTEKVVAGFGSAATYMRKDNGGQASAFNLGLRAAGGDIVCFLDGDDYWLPGKLEAVLDVFRRRPDICAVGHGISILERDGTIDDLLPRQDFEFDLHDHTTFETFDFPIPKALLGSSRLSVRRKTVEAALPIPERLIIQADEWLYTVIPALGRVKILRGPYTGYRMHARNLYMTGGDGNGSRLISDVMLALSEALPAKLEALGIRSELASFLVDSAWVEGQRHRLSIVGGSGVETFRAEVRAYLIERPRPRGRQRLFRFGTLALAGVIGSPAYYRARRWYAEHRLYRARGWLAGSQPSASDSWMLIKRRDEPAPSLGD